MAEHIPKFKKGDILKQIRSLMEGEDPIVTVVDNYTYGSVPHHHRGSSIAVNNAGENSFEFADGKSRNWKGEINEDKENEDEV